MSSRGKWTEAMLEEALAKIRESQISVNAASIEYGIPRRTLRDYIESNRTKKAKIGRRTALTAEQEEELQARIFRLAEVGCPITLKQLRTSVIVYCKEKNLNVKELFGEKRCATRKWARGFLSRHPQIAKRRASHLNEARAQKLNRPIVDDYFGKLKEVLIRENVIEEPEHIYNMDEKGIRLCLHKSPNVLAPKGSRRVRMRGKEHGENVTFVACGNAMGHAIPPMILFKGVRSKDEWKDNLPPGTAIGMTPKGSMTAATFCKWLVHFDKYRTRGKCVLIFDGVKSHCNVGIVDLADKLGITLFVLASNTTHELQPFDKGVFGPFELYWDEELLDYWTRHPTRTLNRQRFGDIFTPTYERAVTAANIKAGFAVTGIFPFNPRKIPDAAFAPSQLTDMEIPKPSTTSTSASSSNHLSPRPSTSQAVSSPVTSEIEFSILITPKLGRSKKVRRIQSINVRAAEMTRELFAANITLDCSADADEPTATSTPKRKKRRGRPKKTDCSEDEDDPSPVSIPKPKRKRGRPKMKDYSDDEDADQSPVSVPKPKKKRGRPKMKDCNDDEDDQSPVSVPKPKKKRGRPKMKDCSDDEDDQSPVSVSEPKKKRGRPKKKNRANDEDDSSSKETITSEPEKRRGKPKKEVVTDKITSKKDLSKALADRREKLQKAREEIVAKTKKAMRKKKTQAKK